MTAVRGVNWQTERESAGAEWGGRGADFESQQSILKWVRRVPGPLQDVMKKQADQLVLLGSAVDVALHRGTNPIDQDGERAL